MDKTGKPKNRRAGVLLLVALFGVGLFWLCLSGVSQAGVKEEWVRRFDSGRWNYNCPNTIHVDKKGSVYVTGFPATVKYSIDGLELWNSPIPSRASCLDDQGNLYTIGLYANAGEWVSEYVTSKYDTHGKLLWEAHYHGPKNYNESPRAIAVDSQGNVYVTGGSYRRDMVAEYATIKYSPDGTLLWTARYHGQRKVFFDFAAAIAVDSRGNVYVTGSSWVSETGYDYATIKYSPDGLQIWVRRYDGPRSRNDYAAALTVDVQGNVYVTGSSCRTKGGTYYDYATIKYSPDGEELWVHRNRGSWDRPRAIAVDSQGNVYVTGNTATIKCSPDGQKLWVRYPGKAMALDSNDNVYVTCYSYSVENKTDYLTIKYSPKGRELWKKYFNGPAGNRDDATAIAVDDYGNVWITGSTYVSQWHPDYYITDYCTIRYRQNGRTITGAY